MTEASKPRMSVCCSTFAGREGAVAVEVRVEFAAVVVAHFDRQPLVQAPAAEEAVAQPVLVDAIEIADVVDVRLEGFISDRRAEAPAAEFIVGKGGRSKCSRKPHNPENHCFTHVDIPPS